MEIFLFLMLIFVAILLFIFWLRQFISLMERSDDTFNGRYDKPIWAAVFLLFGVLGAFIYIVSLLSNDIVEHLEIKETKMEYEQPCLRCGKTIPADSTQCPACGWSYQDEIKN